MSIEDDGVKLVGLVLLVPKVVTSSIAERIDDARIDSLVFGLETRALFDFEFDFFLVVFSGTIGSLLAKLTPGELKN